MRFPISRAVSASIFTALALALPLAAQDQFALQANTEAGLESSIPVTVAVEQAPDGRTYALLGRVLLLELEPYSVRAPGFRLLAQTADGKIVRRDPGPVRTLRGRVVGIPGTVVAASVFDDGLYARIMTAEGEDYWVQPTAAGAAAPAGRHLLYRATDVARKGQRCALDRLAEPRPGPERGALEPSSSDGPEGAIQVAELACDADFEYFSRYGTATNTANRISNVINTVNLQYERDIEATHQITTILVRTSSSQPYTTTDPVDLLFQFRDNWNANHSGVPRDLAQLFTGKEVNGGTIGIAWIGVVCNLSFAYSLVQSDFNNNFGCATDLSAHELGHNWNADHCGCRRNTMNSFITCANAFHGRHSIPEMVGFKNSLSCLGGGVGGTPTSVQAAVTASTQALGKGIKRGHATVVVTDDLGNPVSGAQVTGEFFGTFDEGPFTGSTDASGSVTFQTSGSAKGKASVTFCVSAVSASLPWSQTAPVCDSN